MLGYKPDAQRDKKKRGGRIVGPGTGTSDSIKKDVQDGSYIMPADSTEQIGEQALAGMGGDVPVNVSNGEFEMPPEQVHAIGVQALDQMRNATHEPVPERGLGYGPEEAELFFANGGLVDDEKRKKNSFSQFDPGTQPAAAPSPLADQPARQNVLDTAAQATAQRAQDPIIQNAPKPEEPATLGSVANAGPGTANVGPFEVSHLPKYGQNSNAGQGYDPAAANEAQNKGFLGAVMGDAAPSWDENGQPTGVFQNARGVNRMMAERASESWDRGDYGHAVGTAVAGAPATVLGAGVDLYDSTLKPVLSGATDFARGLFGYDSKQQAEASSQQAPQPAPQRAPQTAAQQAEAAAEPAADAAPADPATVASEGQAESGQPFGQEISPANAQRQTSFDQRDLERYRPENINTISSQAMTAPSEATQQALRSATQDAANRGDWAAVNRQNAINAGYNPAAAQQAQGGGRGAGYTVVRDPSQGERERRQFWNAATTAHRGAQNGQLTAAQLKAMGGLLDNERNDATSRYKSDSTNSANILQENMRQAGQDRREANRNAISTRQQDHAERIAAPQIARSEQLQGLYDAHAAAETPEERSAIQEQMKFLQGAGGQTDNLRNNFMTVGGGQEYDAQAGIMRNVPQQLIDLRTGQPVGGGQGAGAAGGTAPTENHIAALKKDPALKAQFEAKYGPGSAARYGVQ